MAANRADPLASLLALERLGIKFGLENITALCEALGRPQDAWRSVIIAGTNGKGSVAAMVETGLRASGLRTGLYTSPHLVDLEERFLIEGRPIGRGALAETAARVLDSVHALRKDGILATDPTFFEVTTAIAFELFRLARVEVAVLEVGMGGRFDATNVASPLAAAITSIDFDHQQFLGHTLDRIAFEKAGVIKPGMRVVVGRLEPDAARVIARACLERGAPMVTAHDGVTASLILDPAGPVLALRTPARDYGALRPALPGRHQVDNAVVAARMLENLADLGVPVAADAVRVALGQTRWPGRLDLRRDSRGREVLLDAAHNPAGARVLAEYLDEFLPGSLPVVFAVMRDKDVMGTLAPVLHKAAPLVVTPVPTPRAMPPGDVAEAVRRTGYAGRVEVAADVGAALETAWRHAPRICCCGSIFLVGEVLARLGLRAWP